MQRILNVAFKGGHAVHVNKTFRRSSSSWITVKAGLGKFTSSLKHNSGSLIALTGIASAISGGTAFLLSSYGATKEIAKDSGIDITFSKSFPSKIQASEAATVKFDRIKRKDLFVERPSLLKQVTDVINRTEDNEKYFIMYGAKGVGKSTIAERAAKDKRGVLIIRITSAFSRDDVMRELEEVLNISELKPKIVDFMIALEKGMSSEGTLPTFIIEIERSGNLDENLGLQAARSIAKDLSAASNVLIILSEANAVLEFGNDRNRESFIFVGDFSESEAREYISKLNLDVSDEDIQHIIDNIGTNPAMLRSMQEWVHKGLCVKDFVKKELAAARAELVAFPHQIILKALKQHPEGVDPEYFKKIKSEGVDLSNARSLSTALQQSNAIVYRIELNRYMIISRCHQTALKSYIPILPK